jgi:hypothetical protein
LAHTFEDAAALPAQRAEFARSNAREDRADDNRALRVREILISKQALNLVSPQHPLPAVVGPSDARLGRRTFSQGCC